MRLALWQALMAAGEKYGITPYGTEAMHVLRAEKGFIIVGQETDGTVTPQDLGMDWIVSKQKKDFLGKRSLTRADTARADRKQLVGLLTENPSEVIPEGGQIVAELKDKPPMAMLGHVTSSYYSPNCRPLDRAGAGQERPQPHGRDGAYPAGRPRHPRQGDGAPVLRSRREAASMVEAYLRRSPLAHRALAAKAVDGLGRCRRWPGRAAASLPAQPARQSSGNPAFIDARAQRHRPATCRSQANRFTAAGDLACLWLGPNEWLIVGPDGGEARISPSDCAPRWPASTPP